MYIQNNPSSSVWRRTKTLLIVSLLLVAIVISGIAAYIVTNKKSNEPDAIKISIFSRNSDIDFADGNFDYEFQYGDPLYENILNGWVADREGLNLSHWTDSADDFDTDIFDIENDGYDDGDGNGRYIKVTSDLELYAVWISTDINKKLVMFDATKLQNKYYDTLVDIDSTLNDVELPDWITGIDREDDLEWINGDYIFEFDTPIIDNTYLVLDHHGSYTVNPDNNINIHLLTIIKDNQLDRQIKVKDLTLLEEVLTDDEQADYDWFVTDPFDELMTIELNHEIDYSMTVIGIKKDDTSDGSGENGGGDGENNGNGGNENGGGETDNGNGGEETPNPDTSFYISDVASVTSNDGGSMFSFEGIYYNDEIIFSNVIASVEFSITDASNDDKILNLGTIDITKFDTKLSIGGSITQDEGGDLSATNSFTVDKGSTDVVNNFFTNKIKLITIKATIVFNDTQDPLNIETNIAL